MNKKQLDMLKSGEEKLRRLYYLAGCFITGQFTPKEIKELTDITKEDDENEEYAQTFVILTSTGYLSGFFPGNGHRERNKARILEDSKRSLVGVINRVKEMVNKFGEGEEKQKVLTQLTEIQHKSPLLSEYAAQGSINWIGTLLKQASTIKALQTQLS
jgi:hypothetical protein